MRRRPTSVWRFYFLVDLEEIYVYSARTIDRGSRSNSKNPPRLYDLHAQPPCVPTTFPFTFPSLFPLHAYSIFVPTMTQDFSLQSSGVPGLSDFGDLQHDFPLTPFFNFTQQLCPFYQADWWCTQGMITVRSQFSFLLPSLVLVVRYALPDGYPVPFYSVWSILSSWCC